MRSRHRPLSPGCPRSYTFNRTVGAKETMKGEKSDHPSDRRGRTTRRWVGLPFHSFSRPQSLTSKNDERSERASERASELVEAAHAHGGGGRRLSFRAGAAAACYHHRERAREREREREKGVSCFLRGRRPCELGSVAAKSSNAERR